MRFTSIEIIFNPKSTGSSIENAKKLKTQLNQSYLQAKTTLRPTKYAGHAEILAYQLSMSSEKPLIISSSGDGGYNEVVNGVMRAQAEGASPTCTVLPAGNANDHSRTLQSNSLLKLIQSNKTCKIDLLKMIIKDSNQSQERYAHSYIGLGFTPVIAAELNKTDLNALKELWIVTKSFYKYRPFKIKHSNKILKMDSIIFANIGEMAKVLTIAKKSKPDDGYFEVIAFRHNHKIKLIEKLAKATFSSLDSPKKSRLYEFEVLKSMPAQLDGEVIKIKKGSSVKILSEHKILSTLL